MRHRHGLFLFASIALSAGVSAQSDTPPDEALPSEFRGEIDYAGTYSGELVTKRKRMRAPGISEAVRSLTSSRTLPLKGEYAITVRFEGSSVRGSSRPRSTAGDDGAALAPDTFVGTRSGTDCLIQWSEGPQVTARCGRGEFAFGFDAFEDRRGDKLTLAVTAGQARLVDYRQEELDRVAQRVLQIASFAGRIEALRQSYNAEGVMPALACYRMRQAAGLHDAQLTDLAWLAGDLADIGADVQSSGSAEASAALQLLSPPQIEQLAAATREGRAVAEAEYDAACPKA